MKSGHGGIFRNAREAIVFALNFSGAQYSTSSLGNLAQAGAIGSGRGLSGLEGAAQAGMVKRRLAELDAHLLAALIARCSPLKVKDPSGEAFTDGEAWAQAVSEMATYLGSLRDFDSASDVVMRCAVRKYFGEKQTIQEIADKARMHRVTANNQHTTIKRALEGIEAEAWDVFSKSLSVGGMLQE
ncbi:hypothetical protein [Burkholderia anthina]|uniref:hypothetical protein n=1 Tax=Burkholderia anthina TaxID=179879 RepID=UPI0015886224|nr:hypothetical protein [Burkholderia anthina]